MRTEEQKEARRRYNATPHARALKKAESARYYARHRQECIERVERYQATTAGILTTARRELTIARQTLETP